MDNLTWFVPMSASQKAVGANDASAEHFDGIGSAIRENLQNSLDAREDETKPVKVEIALDSIKTRNFPGIENFLSYLPKIEDYWDDNNTNKLIKDVKSCFNSDTIPVLRFSDFNTKGAQGADNYSPDDSSSPWYRLTSANFATGNSSNTTSGGSFGIGKNASYPISKINTLFYLTKTRNSDITYSIGNANLASFYENGEKSSNYFTLSKKSDLTPFDRQILEFNSGYKRTEIGTDVIVMGFYGESSLLDSAKKYVLTNFLASIFFNKLEITIKLSDDNKICLNKDNLNSIIESLKENTESINLIKYYYSALISGTPEHLSEEFLNKYSLNLNDGLLYMFDRSATNDTSSSTVQVVREIGMNIVTLKNYRSYTNISGVFVASGKLSRALRQMEDPTHTKFVPGKTNRYSNSEVSNPGEFLKSLKKEIKTIIDNTVENDDIEIDDNFANQFISVPDKKDSSESGKGEDKNNLNIINPTITNVTIGTKSRRSKKKGGKNPTPTPEIPTTGELPSEGRKPKNKKPKPVNNKNNYSAVKISNDALISKTNEMEYLFIPKNDLNDCALTISINGESSKEAPTVLNASLDNKELKYNNDKSNGISSIYINEPISKGKVTKVKFQLKEGNNVTLNSSIVTKGGVK
ncbi:hypothetical protein FG111_05725 [Lactobacillus kunkeei]|uniref:hypothetical protein n=1 Tax=Apilactobacillus kunkeei TaxID=148814 RepID=UPI00136215FF|nr:hypothetical protein [Apilactobacillus kunkeei]NBI01078.1 hypothetical protein [Apilactobacillus kunkeei]